MWRIGHLSPLSSCLLRLMITFALVIATANNIGYCGYTNKFHPVSQSIIRKSPTARSFALLPSPTQIHLASRSAGLIFARLASHFLIEKISEIVDIPVFSPPQKKATVGLSMHIIIPHLFEHRIEKKNCTCAFMLQVRPTFL